MEILKSLLIAVLLTGLIYWVITVITLPPVLKTILTIILVVAFVFYLIQDVIPAL